RRPGPAVPAPAPQPAGALVPPGCGRGRDRDRSQSHARSLVHHTGGNRRGTSSIGRVTADPVTLSVDCGGGGIKASVLDGVGTMHARPVRTPTPYPLPPDKLVQIIAELAGQLPPTARITVGMPGMIRHGVVVHTPHYITKSGPRTKVLPEL